MKSCVSLCPGRSPLFHLYYCSQDLSPAWLSVAKHLLEKVLRNWTRQILQSGVVVPGWAHYLEIVCHISQGSFHLREYQRYSIQLCFLVLCYRSIQVDLHYTLVLFQKEIALLILQIGSTASRWFIAQIQCWIIGGIYNCILAKYYYSHLQHWLQWDHCSIAVD